MFELNMQDFLSAIFDTLLYQLNDALSRLGKVKRYETDKEGELSIHYYQFILQLVYQARPLLSDDLFPLLIEWV